MQNVAGFEAAIKKHGAAEGLDKNVTTGVSHQFVVDLVCCHLPYKIWFVHHLLSPYLALLNKILGSIL